MKRYRGTQLSQRMAGGFRIWNEPWKSVTPPYFKSKNLENYWRRGFSERARALAVSKLCSRLLARATLTHPTFARIEAR